MHESIQIAYIYFRGHHTNKVLEHFVSTLLLNLDMLVNE